MFLDRDGVINEDIGFVSSKKDFIFKEGIISFLKKAQDQYNYKFIIVTNQSGIGRGYFDENTFLELMLWLNKRLLEKGIVILDTFYCPFHPEFGIGKYKRCSNDRKPRPGMIIKAAKKYNINLKDSVLLGDRLSDVEAAKNANVGKIFLISNKDDNAELEDKSFIVVDNLEKILSYLKS
mgnify:FL=1|tara:strand:+ start:1098 stop:1634 length:537 start_codon:yes stop_codon:yes gene_type:complete